MGETVTRIKETPFIRGILWPKKNYPSVIFTVSIKIEILFYP